MRKRNIICGLKFICFSFCVSLKYEWLVPCCSFCIMCLYLLQMFICIDTVYNVVITFSDAHYSYDWLFNYFSLLYQLYSVKWGMVGQLWTLRGSNHGIFINMLSHNLHGRVSWERLKTVTVVAGHSSYQIPPRCESNVSVWSVMSWSMQ